MRGIRISTPQRQFFFFFFLFRSVSAQMDIFVRLRFTVQLNCVDCHARSRIGYGCIRHKICTPCYDCISYVVWPHVYSHEPIKVIMMVCRETVIKKKNISQFVGYSFVAERNALMMIFEKFLVSHSGQLIQYEFKLTFSKKTVAVINLLTNNWRTKQSYSLNKRYQLISCTPYTEQIKLLIV